MRIYTCSPIYVCICVCICVYVYLYMCRFMHMYKIDKCVSNKRWLIGQQKKIAGRLIVYTIINLLAAGRPAVTKLLAAGRTDYDIAATAYRLLVQIDSIQSYRTSMGPNTSQLWVNYLLCMTITHIRVANSPIRLNTFYMGAKQLLCRFHWLLRSSAIYLLYSSPELGSVHYLITVVECA